MGPEREGAHSKMMGQCLLSSCGDLGFGSPFAWPKFSLLCMDRTVQGPVGVVLGGRH